MQQRQLLGHERVNAGGRTIQLDLSSLLEGQGLHDIALDQLVDLGKGDKENKGAGDKTPLVRQARVLEDIVVDTRDVDDGEDKEGTDNDRNPEHLVVLQGRQVGVGPAAL